MGARFDGTEDALREKFVRHQFWDKEHFGRGDVYERLEKNREEDRPDYDLWRELLSKESVHGFFREDPIQVLLSCATLAAEDKMFPPDWSRVRFGPILEPLHAGLYCGWEGHHIFVDRRSRVPVFFVTRSEPIARGGPTRQVFERVDGGDMPTEAVARVLFNEWSLKYPKWKLARQALCEALSSAIGSLRLTAEQNFDNAVAVSRDADKIVQADWVVVLPGEYPQARHGLGKLLRPKYALKVFSASAFRPWRYRIERYWGMKRASYAPNPVWNRRPPRTEEVAEVVVHVLRTVLRDDFDWGRIQMAYLVNADRKAARTTILLTGAMCCPDPLPAGGVEAPFSL